jgi:hypothetical protein
MTMMYHSVCVAIGRFRSSITLLLISSCTISTMLVFLIYVLRAIFMYVVKGPISALIELWVCQYMSLRCGSRQRGLSIVFTCLEQYGLTFLDISMSALVEFMHSIIAATIWELSGVDSGARSVALRH